MSIYVGNFGDIKKNWWKILAIAFIVSLFNAVIHGLLPAGTSTSSAPSIIVQQGLLPVAFILYGFVYYFLLGCVFVLIQTGLKGSKLVKGFKYGIFLCILTFILYFEPLPHNVLSSTDLLWMLADGIPYILLGIALGLHLADNNFERKKEGSGEKRGYLEKILILVIPLILVVGRLLSYTVLNIYSSFYTLPVITLIWVLAFGLGIGIMYYYLLRPAFRGGSPLQTALFFGVAVFGIYLFLFNFAYALIVSFTGANYVDFFIRSGMDVLFVTMGVFIYESLVGR